MTEWSLFISKANHSISQWSKSVPQPEEAEVEWFYEDLQDLLELTPKRNVLFIIGDWNAKVGSQEIPAVTGKFGLGVQNEAEQRLTEFCQEKVMVRANTLFQQHKRRLYTWTSPDGQYRNQIDYMLYSQGILCSFSSTVSSVQSAKTRPGADCGSDHELFISRFRLKLKEVGKTTRPFRYELKQIPYDYIVELTNRFKGLDLIDRVPEELWTVVCDLVQEAAIKTIPKKYKCKKANWLSEEDLSNWEKKRSSRQRRKGKITRLNAEFQRIVRRDKKVLLSDQCKEIEERNRMGD